MDKEYLQKFGTHLRKLRKAKGLVQDDFDCDRISRPMFGHIELAQSDTTISKVKAIADILGVPVKDLFDFD